MPRLVIAPIVGIAADELPARACVERAVIELTLEAWLEPRRGISPDAVGTSPTLADPARALARACPGRPVSVKERSEFCSHSLVSWTCHGQTKCKLLAHYFMRSNGKITPKIRDYFAEPPSHWTSHSHGNPALRASNVTGDELRPLSSDGESGFTGCSIPLFRRQATRSRDHDDRETNTVSLCQNSAIENTSHYLRRLFCRGVAEPTVNSSRGFKLQRVTCSALSASGPASPPFP